MESLRQGFRFQGEQRLYQIVARRIARMIEANAGNSEWRIPSERDWPRSCRSVVPLCAKR
jgi:GntR family uxuAB operon transcriptional repressor